MRPGVYPLVEKGIYQTSRIANWVGVCFLAGMMLLMTADILLRNLLKIYILGVFEIVEFMCAIFISFALAYCASQRGHICIDIVLSRLPQTAQRVLNSITNVISAMIVALLAWYTLMQGFKIQRSGLETASWYIPVYPFYFVLFAGFVLLCLVWIVQLREHFSGEVTKK